MREQEENSLKWEVRFGKLIKYKYSVGHCNFPKGYANNNVLGRWVHNKRLAYKKNGGSLPGKRVEELNVIGFGWGEGNVT